MAIAKHVLSLKKAKDDPFGLITDLIFKIALRLVSPIPLPDVIASQLKVPILGFIASIAILGLFFLIAAGTVLFSPWILGEGLIEKISQTVMTSNTSSIPVNTEFASTSIPRQNPFGGNGFEYALITAYFLDPQYYLHFGKNHTGIDLVPSDAYYKNSQVYKDFGKVVVYSTITGTAIHYVDNNGGETVEVTNNSQNTKVKFIHFSQVLVDSGEVVAGTPLGIMGSTGFATGDHVHYEVLMKDGDTWRAVNPLNYIN